MEERDTQRLLDRFEQEVRNSFPGVHIEFATQTFVRHVDLWVYVLDLSRYDEVRAKCEEIVRRDGLEEREPEIWVFTKTWTGHWPGGEAEVEMRRQRREEFRKKHGLPAGS